jgi:hypothetical protein
MILLPYKRRNRAGCQSLLAYGLNVVRPFAGYKESAVTSDFLSELEDVLA